MYVYVKWLNSNECHTVLEEVVFGCKATSLSIEKWK